MYLPAARPTRSRKDKAPASAACSKDRCMPASVKKTARIAGWKSLKTVSTKVSRVRVMLVCTNPRSRQARSGEALK